MAREAILQFALNDAERSATSWREIAEEEARWSEDSVGDEYAREMHRGARNGALRRAEEYERRANELREGIRLCKHDVIILTHELGSLRAMCERCGKTAVDGWNFTRFMSLVWRIFFEQNTTKNGG